MSIEKSDSQQTTCNAIATIDGERKQVATATCSIRPGKSLIFSIDLPMGEALEEEDRAAIAEMFRDYLTDELAKAESLGIPI